MGYLNSTQISAVETTDGPIMILAGAGSGKTRTLVFKIIHLIREKKVSPFRILTLTFSNKAAREMRERIVSELNADMGNLQVTTFHSFCARVLRSEANYIGLSRNFTIYDEGESRSLIKKILARKGFSPKDQSPYEIMYYINDLKNRGYMMGGEGFDSFKDEIVDKDDLYYTYYQEYEDELIQANAVDFGGLITGVLQLFYRYPEVLERYQKRFQYVFVDEYQDTNRAQFRLIELISKLNRNICVVGDEDQSIYSWRGADIRNILDFESIYGDAKLIKLEQNYRSSKIIIDAATQVISNNQARKGKVMWTENPNGDDIEIVECVDDRREGEFIACELLRIVERGSDWRDIAVFYRNNSQSRLIEDALRKESIPYRVVAGMKFYERKEIKDMLAYMRLVINHKDSLALSRIINIPTRGIGTTTLRKLEYIAIQNQNSLWETMQDIVDHPDKYKNLRLNSRIQSSLSHFCNLINECFLMEERGEMPSHIYDKLFNESGFLESLKASKNYESLARIENLEELLSGIKQFESSESKPSLIGFLETITLDENQGKAIDEKGEVSLMTIHGSKGLEFNYVFVTGVEESIFPSTQSLGSGEMGLEEERRLFYVAMTRAMKKLYISFAQARMFYGNIKFNGSSRFIDEIPNEYYTWNTYFKSKVVKENCNQDDSIDYTDEFSQLVDDRINNELRRKKKHKYCTYPEGVKVSHALYGAGIILQSHGQGPDEKVTIRFSNGERKKFMVKFAPISII